MVGRPVNTAHFGVAYTVNGTGTATEQWTAYNDFGWQSDQPETNITKITSAKNEAGGSSGLPSSGKLIDYTTGTQKLPELSVTGGTYVVDYGADALAGDAAAAFNGIVSCTGYVGYDLSNPAASVVVRLLNFLRRQSMKSVLFGNRDNPPYEWTRRTKFILSGAEAFTNISSAAVDNHGDSLYAGRNSAWTNLPSYTTQTGVCGTICRHRSG